MWVFVLLLLSVVCLALAAVNQPTGARLSVGWLGLLFFVLIPFIHEMQKYT